jgi:hypothetical protein
MFLIALICGATMLKAQGYEKFLTPRFMPSLTQRWSKPSVLTMFGPAIIEYYAQHALYLDRHRPAVPIL